MRHAPCTALTALVALWTSAGLSAQWGPVTPPAAPGPRSGAMLAYDVVGSRMLMFGGNATNEFWSFSGGTWTQLTPSPLPGPRARANMAADPLTGQILLYGGLGNQQFALDETWVWDGVAWQQLGPTTSPGGRERHGMAFDMIRQTTVLYGGRLNSWMPNQALDQTWEFANGNWAQVIPTQSPPPLVDMAMSDHPGLGQIMLFGGLDSFSTARDETWTYDGTTWTQINTTGPRPAARVGAKMVPVLGRNVCVLCGGRDPVTMQIFNDTWEHDGTTWTQVTNVYGGMYPARAEFGLAHDFARNRLVAFGGVIANNGLRDDTWEYGAQFQPFGLGCAGTAGVPALSAGAPAILGTTCSALLTNLPPSSPIAAMAIGLSRTQWAQGTLPQLLTNLGMPNCRAYTSAELFVTLPASGGTATWSWPVPLLPSLVGDAYYLQGVSFDPGANAAWLTVSNAATLVLGN